MRYAKSIATQELIEAGEYQYSETKYLNMVCPSCGESVIFRRSTTSFRNGKEVKIRSTWCHRNYQEYHAECQLRNQFISKGEIEKRNTIARNQRLVLIEKSIIST